ncbi:WD40 repeat-like protein [Hyaloscypha variabilis F]|uniref:WD40 repeat-like protein n=1 Tax=Hyaloscypha variabilis (strain UAMH 11265 / GT02V1 / F) TaxID=1149755 RepID=A0A2J6R5Z7_HYAVF|nr:WD40 repeat-like protein [Hyaloscypha variabilis F]
MDIHRCRFVPFPPSTINALAFSHSHISKDQKAAPPRLAVGRANGDIELWNPQGGAWLQETIIRGGKDRSIDGLVWTQDPNEEVDGKTFIGKSRLFSIGYTTTVTEWDLAKGRPLRQASGNHGEIWCIAAQPPLSKSEKAATPGQLEGQRLIAGCTDGALVLYSTEDEDLQLQRVLVRPSAKKAKVISVVFQNRNIVVAGCTDSTIRIYDIRTGAVVRNMTLGSGPKGGPKEIIVWAVKVLRDGTIVSGDSTGEIKIWDGKLHTLRQRIKSHQQDILSLATNFDGSAIFSGGMDRRTVVYKPIGKGKSRWAEVAHRRFHTHDVKTMASFEGSGLSVIVSGGPDASPTVVPLGQYGFENQRSLPFFPQDTLIRSAPKQGLMMSFWEREVHIWHIRKDPDSAEDEEDLENKPPQGRKLVAKILIKGEPNITSAALNSEGSLLAVSTNSEIKLFQLRPKPEEDILRVSKLPVPSSFSSGARLIQFSPDGKWLCIVRPDSQIVLSRLLTPGTSSTSPPTFHPRLTKIARLDRKTEKHVLLGGLGSYNRTVTQLAFSADSRILAVSDISGHIDTFVLTGQEDLSQQISPDSDAASSSSSSSSSSSESDSEDEEDAKTKAIFGQTWTRNPSAALLPKLPSAPVVLSFRPSAISPKLLNGTVPLHPTRNTPHPISHALPTGEDRLLVITSTSQIYEFSVLKGSLTPWSRRNPTSVFPDEFKRTLETVRGCIWDTSLGRERAWIYSVGWIWMFDLSRDFPSPSGERELVNGDKSKKRKRNGGGKERASGAGGAIPDELLGTGISRRMQRVVHEEVLEESTLIQDPMDVDEAEEDNVPELALVRRGSKDEGKGAKGKGRENGYEARPHEWHTFKYRPIMGVVLVGKGTEGLGPEVAVVERPAWEAGLPGRWEGEQEWREKEVGL